MIPVVEPLLDSVHIVSGPGGDHWDAHTHPDHELLSAVTRRVTVVTPDAVFIAPPGASVWIPAGVPHEVRAAPGNRMRCSWFDPASDNALTDRVVVATLPPLLDHVLAYIQATDDLPQRLRAEAFALDLLTQGHPIELSLPTPRAPWLRRMTDALIADPTDHRTIEGWATELAVSVRTLTRTFRAETGMTVSAWRADLRLRLAMSMLADGTDVGLTARAVGFESLPAFSAAFRRHTGVSPRAFARTQGSVTAPPLGR